jgi:hypothetical protein
MNSHISDVVKKVICISGKYIAYSFTVIAVFILVLNSVFVLTSGSSSSLRTFVCLFVRSFVYAIPCSTYAHVINHVQIGAAT